MLKAKESPTFYTLIKKASFQRLLKIIKNSSFSVRHRLLRLQLKERFEARSPCLYQAC